MAKTEHTCKDNEHMGSLASKYDFFDWNTLWDTNQNLQRTNPTVLYKALSGGDIVECPEKKEKKETCQVDQEHVFQVPTYKMWLRLRILNEAFAPIKDTNYELEVDKVVEPFKDKTKDGLGLIEHEIPVDASTATLCLLVKPEDTDPPKKETESGKEESKKPKPVRGDVPITWKLKIGKLNPIDEEAPNEECVSGFQQRMNNLALNSGPVDGKPSLTTKAAIKAFQDLYQIKTSKENEGIPDDNTHKTLVKVHDGPKSVPPPPKPDSKKEKM